MEENKDRNQQLSSSLYHIILNYLEECGFSLYKLAEEQNINCFFEFQVDGETHRNIIMPALLEIVDPITGKPFKDFSLEDFSSTAEEMAEIPHVKAVEITALDYPTDKVNGNAFDLTTENKSEDGYFHISTKKKGSKNEVDIIYNIDFNAAEQKLTEGLKDLNGIPELTQRTKRVMIACNALYKQNEYFSKTQLYHAMGYTGSPGKADMDALDKDLDLLLSKMDIDNIQEIEAGYKYPHFIYHSTIMPHERLDVYINGQLAKDAIHLFRQPPLMAFAEGRKQIATIPLTLLENSRYKTQKYLKVEDYIITRIAAMKNSKRKSSNKILFSTVFTRCNITDKKQKTRTKKSVLSLLEFYKEQEYIKGFSETKDGVIVFI